MKKIVFLLLTGFILFGCANKKADRKAGLDSVISIHDKVMVTEDRLMKNKMLLDTFIIKKHLSSKDTAVILKNKLIANDDAMEKWMVHFDSEQKGRSDEEAINYLHQQKRQIMSIDSQMNTLVMESGKYLKQTK